MKYSSALFVVFLRLGSSDSNFHPSDGVSRYLFTQHVSVDPDEDSVNLSSETESLAFYSDSEEQMDESASSLVSSSLLYDGGCLMSSQALMCNGGDLFLDTNMPLFDPDYETDDEDDDDDDGHSSMLSNASVRRARASANGVSTNSEPTEERMAASTGTFFHSRPPEKHSQSAFLAKNSVLSIRG
jgi:hypothetical protein